MHGYTGKGADGDRPGLQAVNIRHLLLQLLIPFQDLPHCRHHLLPVHRQPHSGTVPQQERESELMLQTADRMADPRLGEAKHLRRFRKTAQLHHFQEDLIFDQTQRLHASLCINISHVSYDKHSVNLCISPYYTIINRQEKGR
ncbi:hypothetical protein D3C73_881550 [compost metagenome]